MNLFYLIGGLTTLGLAFYLWVALLFPEKF